MIGARLKQLRIIRGLTQQDLSERANIAQRNITRYENNESDPNGETLYRIAVALDTSTDYLLGLTDDPTPPTRSPELTELEQRIIEAFRRGENMEAIMLIAGATV